MIQIDFTTRADIVPDYIVDEWGIKRIYDENGELHSYNDLPAVITPLGSKHWYKHGKLHRENGLPAISYSGGQKEYWIDGIKIK